MGRRAAILLVLIGLSAGTLSGATLAAFSSTTTNNNDFVAASSFGGIEFVKNVGSFLCGGATSTVTVPAGGVAAGSTLIIRFVVRNGSTITVTASDSRGNPYQEDLRSFVGNVSTTVLSGYISTPLLQGDTIVVVHPNHDTEVVIVDQFSGIANANRVDATGITTGISSTPSVSATTTTASTLLIGSLAIFDHDTVTAATGWPSLTGASATCGRRTQAAAAYRIVNAAGTYAWSPTLLTARTWAAALVAYKAA
jgi:predicted ribosomally synthesized peptide with SipW-like signal peptide